MKYITTVEDFNSLPDDTIINCKHGEYWTDDDIKFNPDMCKLFRELGIGLEIDGYAVSSSPFYLFKKKTIPDNAMVFLAVIIEKVRFLDNFTSITGFTLQSLERGPEIEKCDKWVGGSYWGGDKFARAFSYEGVFTIAYGYAINVTKYRLIRKLTKLLDEFKKYS